MRGADTGLKVPRGRARREPAVPMTDDEKSVSFTRSVSGPVELPLNGVLYTQQFDRVWKRRETRVKHAERRGRRLNIASESHDK